MGPLSGKQHREYLKFQNKEAREAAKMELDEKRKQQLHEIKLQEAAAKANQGLGHKEKVNNAKLKEMGIPLPKGASINKQKLGIPSTNPIAGTGMFKQGQHKLAEGTNGVQGTTDTVPAMLTPGEAVIPAPAAQDPKNKKAIQRMVEEGRRANALRDGAVDVRYSDAPGQAKYHEMGTTQVVPSLAYEHSDVPGSSFNDGTEHVFSRGSADMQHYSNGTYGVVPQQVQSAAGYSNGTEEVSYLDRFLNYIAGQETPQTKTASAPLATEKPNTVSKEDFFKMRSIAEASGNPYAVQKQKDQTAAGLTGTTAGTLKLYQKVNPELRGVEHKSEAYFKPEFQRKLSDTQYDDYVKQLNKKGLPITMENLYAAGFGPRGVSAVAASNEDKLVNHFNKEELKNNKYFGNTAGDFKNFLSKKASEAGKSLGQVATNMIPSAQAGTLDSKEPQAPLATTVVNSKPETTVVKPEVSVAKPDVPPSGRDVLIAKQNLATSTDPKLIQASKDVLSKANQSVPTLADTRGSIINTPLTAMEPPLFNKDQQDLIRLSEIINDPATTPNDKKWAYTEINRITRNGQPVSPVGVGTARSISNRVLGSETQADIANLPKNEPYPEKEVPEVSPNATAEPPYVMQGEGIKAGGSLEGLNTDKAGEGFKKKDTEEAFNKLGIFSGNVFPEVQAAVDKVKSMPIDNKEKEGVLSKMLSSLFGESGLFGDKELLRFSLLAAGGMLTGGSVGGSLKYAGLHTLQYADKNQATKQAAIAEASKNQRELAESLQKEFRTSLANNIPADVKRKALEYMSNNPAKSPQEDVARHRAVLQYLAENVQNKDANADKYSDFKSGYIGNTPVDFVTVKNDKGVPQRMIVSQDKDGNQIFVKPQPNQTIVDSGEWNKRQDKLDNQIKETIGKPIADVVLKANKNASKAQIDAEVNSVAASFKFFRNEISPKVSDVQFSKMVENTMQSIREEKNTNFSPEAIRMSFYGNAVIKLRETNKEKYYNASMSNKSYEQPSASGNAEFGSVLSNRVKDMLEKPEYQNLSHDDALNKVVGFAEDKWDKLSPEQKKSFALRTPRDANNDKRYRVSPMMQWVIEGGLDK
jgi:hypothetical protein